MKTKPFFVYIVRAAIALAIGLTTHQQAWADSFILTRSMKDARMEHDAVRLPSGLVLVAGGVGTNGYLNTAELFNPDDGTWSSAGNMAAPRAGFRLTLLPNGKVLASGGINTTSNTTTYLTSAEIFDPNLKTWSPAGNLQTGRVAHVATLLTNGLVLVAGGFNNSGGQLASAEVYDPNLNTWTPTNSMNSAHYGATAALLPDGDVLVAAGDDQTGSPTSAEVFHMASGTWTQTTTMIAPRDTHAMALLANGLVLVAGGYGISGVLNQAELFNSSGASWSPTGSMMATRRALTMTLLTNGFVLAAGGDSVGNSAELFNPNTGTWAFTSSQMHTPRDLHTATLLANGAVLIVGGNIGSGPTNSAELYSQTIGSLTVTINPPGAVTAGAQWQVDGGAFQNSGAVVTNLVAGNHTVTFSTVPQWITPSAQLVAVTANTTNIATGIYTAITGSLQVNLDPPEAVSAGAKWQVDGGPFQNSGAIVNGLTPGNHNVAFSTVPGWVAPAGQVVSVSADTTNIATGTYLINIGALRVNINPPGAVSAGAQWQLDGGAFQNSGDVVTNLGPGTHSVAFRPISGWVAPATQNVTVSAGATNTSTATYSLLGLVSYWPFDSTPLDVKGTNNALLSGSVSYSNGEAGLALAFNGVDTFARVLASATLNVAAAGSGLTIAAWINPDDVANSHALFEWNNGQKFLGVHFYVAAQNAGSLYANVVEVGNTYHILQSASGLVSPHQWQHVALTYDIGTGMADLYLNGSQVAEQHLGSFVPETSFDLYFGERASSPINEPPFFYGGLMDDVRLANRALSPAEIAALAGPTVSPLIIVNAMQLPDGVVQLSWTNMLSDTNTVLATTNIQTASTNWDIVGSGLEISPGVFQFRDSQVTNCPLRFYRIRSP